MSGPVAELRLALTVSDYAAAVRFYRDALGLPVEESWDEPQGRGTVLGAGHATIELIDEAQARHIDDVEVGRPIGAAVRIALQVSDSAAVGRTLTEAGATALAEPTITPWRHRNVRLAGPDGMQLTLFTVLDDDDTPAGRG